MESDTKGVDQGISLRGSCFWNLFLLNVFNFLSWTIELKKETRKTIRKKIKGV